jgi:hypothetical protein
MSNDASRATPETRGAEAAARYRGWHGDALDGQQTGRGPRPRPRHVLEVEDVVLAGWVFGIEELVRRWTGDPLVLMGEMTTPTAESSGGWMALIWSLTPVGWLFVGLFLFILLTRGPEDTDRDVALGRRWPMLAMALPLLSIYALIASGIQSAIFGSPDLKPGQLPPWPGPYVPGWIRRTASVPVALLGDALFRSEIAFANLGAAAAPLDPDRLLPTMLMMLASAFPFMLFVAGPRIAAGAALAWTPWIVRFAVFYISSWGGIYWGAQ